MSDFIVSARKYRPATFRSVVGQKHITSTLQNAIERGQLAHAYLFCGPRGVGKTTCARIFAKAINCLAPDGAEACNECESCRSFNEGRSLNIHELDAASNNSVEDIRTLIEQVRIIPQVGRYSVFIIDEVHMLSAAAFNAFLKTLEEPPAHVIFILATTEKHKIIPTILSRCQIYDFNRIRVEDSVEYLKYIASQEGSVEVVYAAVKTHKLVNRGFLCGPICPIYGFGMVGLVYSVSLIPMPDSGSMSAVAIFFIGMILTTAIELVGGWALFKIYHIRWWDYSNMKFNLGGYICPQFSLLWGLGSVLMIKVVHPLLARGSSPMPFNIMLIVDVVLLVLFVVDVAASTAAAIGLNEYLREIDELRAKLRVTSDKLTTVLGTGAMTADTILDEQKLQLALAKLEGRENADVLRAELTIRAAALREKLTSAEHDHLGTRRLLRAFPDMKSLNYADTLATTRAAMLRLRELAAAAKDAARETAANAKEKIKKA